VTVKVINYVYTKTFIATRFGKQTVFMNYVSQFRDDMKRHIHALVCLQMTEIGNEDTLCNGE